MITQNSENPQNIINPIQAWLGFGAEFITIFIALILLSGRIYAQSYWNVFGLSADNIFTNFLDYTLLSPNVAVISVFITMTTMLVISLFRRQLPDFIGDKNPRVSYFIGFISMWVGIFFVSMVPRWDLSSWTPGLAGLVFGIGYLCFIGGSCVWLQAGLKLDTKQENKDSPRWKWQIAVFRWLQNIPRVFLLVFVIVGFSATAIWALADTSQKFGANEAKFMLITRPEVTLILDSPKGFEDLVSISDTGTVRVSNVLVIAETDEFTYFCFEFTEDPPQLHIRAIPSSRIQAINYATDFTHLGE